MAEFDVIVVVADTQAVEGGVAAARRGAARPPPDATLNLYHIGHLSVTRDRRNRHGICDEIDALCGEMAQRSTNGIQFRRLNTTKVPPSSPPSAADKAILYRDAS